MIALKVPVVAVYLDKFAAWAGVFMQVAGLLEALRRLARNTGVFSIQPASPTVALAGTAMAGGSFATMPGRAKTLPVSVPTRPDRRTAEAAVDHLAGAHEEVIEVKAVLDAEEANMLEDIERILTNSDMFARDPILAEKTKRELAGFMFYRPDGTRDVERIEADPNASRAMALFRAIEHAAAADDPLPPGMSAADTSIYLHDTRTEPGF